MIDIHAHILPMMDDGVQSVEEALEMLFMAYQDGTDVICLTPHFALDYGFVNPKEKIREYYSDLKEIVKMEQLPITLCLGCEYLYTTDEAFDEAQEAIQTMNRSRYILIEFYFDVEKETILQAIRHIRESHWIPIIAHPERYDCIQADVSIAIKIKQLGGVLQVNKGSFKGRYGSSAQECTSELMDKKLVDFVSSDAHSSRHRNPLMQDTYQYVVERYGKHYADLIFEINAKKMLKGMDIRK